METIDITPSWTTAVRIYAEILISSSDRDSEAVNAATDDLLRLAKYADSMNVIAMPTAPFDPNQLTLQF